MDFKFTSHPPSFWKGFHKKYWHLPIETEIKGIFPCVQTIFLFWHLVFWDLEAVVPLSQSLYFPAHNMQSDIACSLTLVSLLCITITTTHGWPDSIFFHQKGIFVDWTAQRWRQCGGFEFHVSSFSIHCSGSCLAPNDASKWAIPKLLCHLTFVNCDSCS